MDLSTIDWSSFVRGLATGLGAWGIWTVLKSGWTVIEYDRLHDVFDDEDDVCLKCRLHTGGPHPHVATIRRYPAKW